MTDENKTDLPVDGTENQDADNAGVVSETQTNLNAAKKAMIKACFDKRDEAK